MSITVTGRAPRAAVAVACVAVALLAAPLAVLAHAELDTATPADGAVLDVPPTEIVLTFTEDLDPSRSSIVVVDAGGATVASGGEVGTSDLRRMTLAVANLTAGAYEIRWTSGSAVDGDIARGTTTFTVNEPTPSPTPSPTATPTPVPSATPAPTPSPSPSPAPSPSADTTSGSGADVILPIVVAIVVVAVLGAWLLNRSRGSKPA